MLTFPDPNIETEYTDSNGSVWAFNGTGWVRQCESSGGGGGGGSNRWFAGDSIQRTAHKRGSQNLLRAVDYNGDFFAAGGDSGVFIKSVDGRYWDVQPQTLLRDYIEREAKSLPEDEAEEFILGSGNVAQVKYGNGRWVLCSGGQYCQYSTDSTAESWVHSPDLKTVLGSGSAAILATDGAGTWLAGHANNGYAKSVNNAENWTGPFFPDAVNTRGIYGATYGNGVWVVVGDRKIHSSDDIENLIDRARPVNVLYNDVAYGDGVFRAVGASATMIKSYDGETWVDDSANIQQAFDALDPPYTDSNTITGQDFFSITHANGYWFVAGRHGRFACSRDGDIWKAMDDAFYMSMVHGSGSSIDYDIAASGGTVVLAGGNNNNRGFMTLCMQNFDFDAL